MMSDDEKKKKLRVILRKKAVKKKNLKNLAGLVKSDVQMYFLENGIRAFNALYMPSMLAYRLFFAKGA
jgi:hypothetical protein